MVFIYGKNEGDRKARRLMEVRPKRRRTRKAQMDSIEEISRKMGQGRLY